MGSEMCIRDRLTIEAGTTIKSEPKSAGAFDPGTLVITQGSKIEAVGTAEAPIIFTSTEDDGSLTEADSGLWGGVILLGKATINRPAGTEYIEGLPTSDLGIYGGDDAADNSGTLKYVSIRHGGAAIASDNEINGLTMGGVGSATTIEYVEVFANADDGFEWFGGTVNSKYLVGAFNNDDTFDWDEGFTGKGQFWFAIQAEGGDRGAEMDGGPSSAPDAEPYSTPVIYNATFIGAGADGDSQVMKFRENTGGIYANSIFTGFEKGVDVDTGGKDGATIASGQDSEARFTAGDLALKANIYHDIAGASDIAGIVAIGDSDGANADFKSNFTSALTSAGSTFEDPQLAGISRVEGAALDPRPATDGPAYSGLTSLPTDDVFYSSVSHKGAFGTADWTGSWSKTGASYTGDIFTPVYTAMEAGLRAAHISNINHEISFEESLNDLKSIGEITALMAEAGTAGDNPDFLTEGMSGDTAFPFVSSLKAIATVGEYDVNNGQVLTGYPDGQAAWLADDDTVRVAYQSESYATMSSETYPWVMANGASFTGSHIHTIAVSYTHLTLPTNREV